MGDVATEVCLVLKDQGTHGSADIVKPGRIAGSRQRSSDGSDNDLNGGDWTRWQNHFSNIRD
jgi:hypothetical protein